MTALRQWLDRPQNVWLRRALFQIHLWVGLAAGLYMVMISLTGSVLVYRNELYRAATPPPRISTGTGPRLSDDDLKQAAVRLYPGFAPTSVTRFKNPDQAVEVWLRRGEEVKKRLFDVRSGADLDDAIPPGITRISQLLDLHDNLLGGPTGRLVNGYGAGLLIVLAITGLVVWWPGVRTWSRGLWVRRGVGWKRVTWDIHSVVGFWSALFLLLFGITGLYLGNPDLFQNLGEWIEPTTETNAGDRVIDQVMYWLAFLHFGRFGGRVPWCGRGACDQTLKAVWAAFGLAPAALLVTGVVMWWNRVVRRTLIVGRSQMAGAATGHDSGLKKA